MRQGEGSGRNIGKYLEGLVLFKHMLALNSE